MFSANAPVYVDSDMVLFAIDLTEKCYAVKMFPTPYDANAGTFDEYLTKSIDDAERLCNSISEGMVNTRRHPAISECDDVSPFILNGIIESLIFGN